MSDVMLTCVDCQQSFEWTYGEQRFYRENKLHQPTHCPACRQRRSRARDTGMQSEVGPSALFSDDDQGWEHLIEQAQPTPPNVMHQPAAAPHQKSTSPNTRPGIDVLRIAVFLWIVVMLVAFKLFGWPAAAILGCAGIAIAIWYRSRRSA